MVTAMDALAAPRVWDGKTWTPALVSHMGCASWCGITERAAIETPGMAEAILAWPTTAREHEQLRRIYCSTACLAKAQELASAVVQYWDGWHATAMAGFAAARKQLEARRIAAAIASSVVAKLPDIVRAPFVPAVDDWDLLPDT